MEEWEAAEWAVAWEVWEEDVEWEEVWEVDVWVAEWVE
jgi:hypothetical protein